MEKLKNNELKTEIARLIEEASTIGPMMRGSVTLMGKKNKQPYFSVGIKGKTKIIYLGNKRAKLALEYTANLAEAKTNKTEFNSFNSLT